METKTEKSAFKGEPLRCFSCKCVVHGSKPCCTKPACREAMRVAQAYTTNLLIVGAEIAKKGWQR